MADSTVRKLTAEEHVAAARLVSQVMLGSVTDELAHAWAALWGPDEAHGAFTSDDELAGVVRWFRDEVAVPGGSLPVAAITAVAVLPTHRRRGHLTRLIEAQLEDISAAGVPMATLVAAEWPIYGRFGYGPAMDACAYEVDAATARFREPPTGRIELVTPSELRPHLEAVHAARWARTPGSLRRSSMTWERLSGVDRWPGDTSDPGQLRGAIWRADDGVVRGAVSYRVTDSWTRNRPQGKAETVLLVGDTPEAERELWRHLCELDWVATVVGGLRAVDDPLPLFLTDGRAAAQIDRSDAIWARILDVPAAFAARRSPVSGGAVLEVTDPQGYASGRWAIELGPDGGSAAPSDAPAEVHLPVDALGAAFFGGHSARRLADAGRIDELVPGSVDRLSTLLATPVAPWSTTSY
jgi:predicted acetyltransferase